MRLLAVSIVILAGAVMATGGVIAENLPDTRTRNNLDLFGLLLSGFGCSLFTLEWLAGMSACISAHPPRSDEVAQPPLHPTGPAYGLSDG